MFRTITHVTQESNDGVIYRKDEQRTEADIVSVKDFYKDRNVFITGSTGFLGQCLVEKLLRSCPEIGRIYLPIRKTERGDTAQRFERFLKNSVFDVLREIKPDFRNKLVPLSTSLEETNLGLSGDMFERLTEEVSVIFHVAASIRLSPPLREVIVSNILVSTNVFRFGKLCKHLVAYIHVSTLYAHADLEFVEKVYPTNWTHKELIEIVDNERELKRNASNILGSSPCTYFASKKVAEYMMKLEMGTSAVAILRPGKVSPSLCEPVKSWSQGYASYIPWLTMVENGLLNCHLGIHDDQDEIIPVDICINSFINTAWYLGTKLYDTKENSEPFVVNLHSSKLKHLTTDYIVTEVNKCLEESGRRTQICLISSRLRIFLRQIGPIMKQTVRAWMKRKKPLLLLLVLFTLFDKGIYSVQVKNNRKEYTNLEKINNSLEEADKQEFPCDLTMVNWSDYIRTWFLTLKEKREAKERAKRQRK